MKNLRSGNKPYKYVRSNRRHRGNHEEPEFSNQSIMNAMEKFVSTVQEMDETILVPCRLMDLKIGDASDMTPSGEAKAEIQSLMKHADLYSLYTMVNSVKNELLWGHNNTPSEEPAGPLFVPGVVVGTNYISSGGLTSLPPSSHSVSSSSTFSSLPASTGGMTTMNTSTSTTAAATTTTPNNNNNNNNTAAAKTHSRNSSASNIKPDKSVGGVGSHQRRPSTGSLVSTHSMTSMSLSDTDSEAGNENDSGIEDGNAVDPTVQIALNFRRHLTGLHKSLEQMTHAASYLTQRYQHDVGGNV